MSDTRPSHTDVWLGLCVVGLISVAYVWWGGYVLWHHTRPAETRIDPFVFCVAADPGDPASFLATFGYERTGGSGIAVMPMSTGGDVINYVAADAQVLPDRYGMPTQFPVGRQDRAFTIRASRDQTVTWHLTTDRARRATATASTTTACPASPDATAGR